jgi:hypothetical protein
MITCICLIFISRRYAYHDCDKKVKDIPSIIPETPETVNPLDNNLQHKNSENAVIKHIQGDFKAI